MIVYLKLPKKDPRKLGYMFNKLTQKDLCDKVEYNTNLVKLLKVVPLFKQIGSTTISRNSGDMTISQETYNEVIEGVDIIVNPDIYKRELDNPNPDVRREAAEEFLYAAVTFEGLTLKEFLVFAGISAGGIAILIPLAHRNPSLFIVTVIALILVTVLYSVHVNSSQYKRVEQRAINYGFVTPTMYDTLVLDEVALNNQAKNMVKYIFKLAKNGNKTALKKIAFNLLSKTAPKNTFAYKHNAKVIQSL